MTNRNTILILLGLTLTIGLVAVAVAVTRSKSDSRSISTPVTTDVGTVSTGEFIGNQPPSSVVLSCGNDVCDSDENTRNCLNDCDTVFFSKVEEKPNGALIEWTSEVPTVAEVTVMDEVDLDPRVITMPNEPSISHQVSISGLITGGIYNIHVDSKDEQGNLISERTLEFVTNIKD